MVVNSSGGEENIHLVIYSVEAVSVAVVCCILFIILGVLGNLWTILAVLYSPKLRSSPTSIFILSLSLTDLIFCAFNLPIQAVRWSYQAWTLGTALCTLFPFVFYLNVAASLFNMTAITINRYVLIAHYTSYDRIYRRPFIYSMIAVCWLFPIVLMIPPLTGTWGRFGYKPATFSCTVLKVNGSSPKKLFFLLGFFLPILVIVICYARIFSIVRNSRRNLDSSRSSPGRKKDKESMILTRMVAVIFGTFIICYLPLMCANVLDENDEYPLLHVIASLLAYSASVLNPFIYGLMSTRYRQAYSSIIPCLRHRLNNQLSGTQVTTSSGNNHQNNTNNNNHHKPVPLTLTKWDNNDGGIVNHTATIPRAYQEDEEEPCPVG